MNKKTVTIILVVVAILLVGFLIFRPSDKQEEIPQEPVVTEPVETPADTEQEIVFEEGVMVVGVTSADEQGFVADEYELVLEEGEEIIEDANALDLAKYVATENSLTYTFDGSEVIRLAGEEVLEEAEPVEEIVEEETETAEEEVVTVKIEAGDKLALVLENGVKTIVVYKA